MQTPTTADNLPGRSTRRLTALLLVLAGLLVVGLASWRVLADYRTNFSPLDEVDVSQGQDEGFIPLYLPEREVGQAPQGTPGAAPTLALAAPPLDRSTGPDGEAALAATATPPAGDAAGSQVTPAPTPTRRGVDTTRSLPFPTPVIDEPPRLAPDRIVIPAIGLDAPVVPVHLKEVEAHDGNLYQQWIAPYEFAAGWHDTSATLGEFGNLVLNGHHNIAGEVFRDLHTLEVGDTIFVYSGDQAFAYQVGLNLRFKERFEKVEVRLQNAQWILPSQDERLTLITCWPYESNTHRIVIVALPVETRELP